MNLGFLLNLSTLIVVLLLRQATCCLPQESRKGRPLDGSLKCYQCTSSSAPDDRCRASNRKHANRTERRFMEMQCPPRLSAFCLLKIHLADRDLVERGCFRDTYPNGNTAKIGCSDMGDKYHFCLCATDLCNTSRRPALEGPYLMLLSSLALVFNQV